MSEALKPEELKMEEKPGEKTEEKPDVKFAPPGGSDYVKQLVKADKLLPAGALLFGILFVYLFYGKMPGISVPIFILAFYALLLAYTKPVLKKEARFGWFLCIPILMLSLTCLLFGNQALLLLNILVLPTLILLQTILITGVNSFQWHSLGIILDLILGVFYRCMAHVSKPFGIIKALVRQKAPEKKGKSVAARVGIGLVFSVPLVLVLLVLLTSADMVFGNMVGKLPNIFEGLDIGDLIGKAFVTLIIFFITFSYLWSLAHGDRPAESSVKGAAALRPPKDGCWDIITVITVMAAVDILYIIFVVIQFAYLFGGSGLPDGFTYSEYARNGFFELILVTLLNIGLLAFTLTYTKKSGKTMSMAFRILNTVMICCTFVMLVSAHYRMSLYEEAYGYTFLRVMTHAFMVFLLVLFVITLARVWVERLPLLKPYIVTAVIAFVIVNYINVDTLIARKNIERYQHTKVIDMNYFRTLSNDIINDLKMLAEDPNPEVAVAAREQLENRKERLAEPGPWQSFNLPDYKARKVLGE